MIQDGCAAGNQAVMGGSATCPGVTLAADPELAGEVQLAGAVLDFTRGNETFLTSS